jgi:hypothetical protein
MTAILKANHQSDENQRGGMGKPCTCLWSGLVSPLVLSHARMQAGAREIAHHQESVELYGPFHLAAENHDLVELQSIQQVIELSVLLRLCELDVVLLQTVQSQLVLLVNIDFEWLRRK